MAVTVSIRYAALTHGIFAMKQIARSASSSAISVQLNDSKGGFADELQKTADVLREADTAFADLASRTSRLLEETRDKFMQADIKAAEQFRK